MRTRSIGTLEVSEIGLGCNNFGWRLTAEQTRAVVDAALESGVTFFDTADIYGGGRSEEFLGQALRGRRDGVIIASKFGKPMEAFGRGARPDYIRKAVAGSLRRLGIDTIDLYQLHEPDPDVPIAETLDALTELVRAGTVREIGCSNFSVAQLEEAQAAATGDRVAFASVQNEYSLMERDAEDGMLEACERLGVAFLPYYPLASGLLTGKYRKGRPAPEGTRIGGGGRYADLLSDENLTTVESLIDFARAHGHTVLELAFAWLLSRGVVASVIAGATRPEQVRANAAVDWRLSSADAAAVDRLVQAA